MEWDWDFVWQIMPTLVEGAKITVVFDQAPFIQESITALAEEGLLGLLFAVAVLAVVVIMILFPEIVMFLPDAMMG